MAMTDLNQPKLDQPATALESLSSGIDAARQRTTNIRLRLEQAANQIVGAAPPLAEKNIREVGGAPSVLTDITNLNDELEGIFAVLGRFC